MKWEAVLLMLLLIMLGFWLVYRAGGERGDFEVQLGQNKAAVTQLGWPEDGARTFTLRYRDGKVVGPVSESTFRDLFGDEEVERVLSGRRNAIFRLLNISTWTSLPWVVIGFGAQMVFATRFLLQWIVSERKKESVIPVAFWWVSFFGGVALFAYFVWRQDLPAVLWQSSGIVIYARNLRLIYKKQRRDARAASRTNGESTPQSDTQPTPQSET
jgi:lipid-A-disaccharide synthase-like uncharacterized protein